MVTFLIGLAVLAAGGFWYGRVCEREFGPDDRPTPAVTLDDGVDYVPMNKWKNSLIELLNIGGDRADPGADPRVFCSGR